MTAPHTLTRRAVLRAISSGAGLALLAACAPITPPAPTMAPAAAPTPAPTPPAAAPAAAPASTAAAKPAQAAVAQPRTGGTLRMAMSAEINTLDGHLPASAALSNLWQVYERLTAFDDKLQPQPMLAESWDVSSDYRQVKFNLRKGVQFHTGREFTSEDVQWNIERIKDPKVVTGQMGAQAGWWSSIETPDKSTVIFRSDVPRPGMFDLFEYANMLDRDTMTGPDAATKAVGTGPFMLGERQPGVSTSYQKNKSYWQSGRPYLDEFVISIAPDPQAMLLQLEAGQIDLVDALPLNAAARFQRNPAYTVVINPTSGNVSFMVLNVTAPPLDNKKVRQALQYAVDRKRIVETAHLNTSQSRVLPWATSSVAYDAAKNTQYAFDLDKARALLREANVESARMELSFSASLPEFGSYAQIYQADLAKIGITTEIKRLEAAAWRDDMEGSKWQGVTFGRQQFTHLDPASSLAAVYLNPATSRTLFRDEKYASLVAAATVEADKARQKTLYDQVNDVLLDEAFALAVSSNPGITAARANVQGIRYDLHEGLVVKDIWLSA